MPYALHASCNGSCSDRTGMILHPIDWEAGMTTLTCTAQVRLDGFSGGTSRVLDVFGFSTRNCSQSCDYTIQLALTNGDGASIHNYIHDGAAIVADTDTPLTFGLSSGPWHVVEISATYGASSTIATISVDGVSSSPYTYAAAPKDAPVNVMAGVSYTHNSSTNWQLHYDDVVCDWSP
jgi:hypothetical protein